MTLNLHFIILSCLNSVIFLKHDGSPLGLFLRCGGLHVNESVLFLGSPLSLKRDGTQLNIQDIYDERAQIERYSQGRKGERISKMSVKDTSIKI